MCCISYNQCKKFFQGFTLLHVKKGHILSTQTHKAQPLSQATLHDAAKNKKEFIATDIHILQMHRLYCNTEHTKKSSSKAASYLQLSNIFFKTPADWLLLPMGRRLGKDLTDRRSRKRLKVHLWTSLYHRVPGLADLLSPLLLQSLRCCHTRCIPRSHKQVND